MEEKLTVQNKEENMFILPELKLYELDIDKIQTLEDVKQILIDINLNIIGDLYFEKRPNLKKYYRERK